jgi:hypothetical protein
MNSETPENLRVEFVKGGLFRVVHADGAFGGITPHLGLFITFQSPDLGQYIFTAPPVKEVS